MCQINFIGGDYISVQSTIEEVNELIHQSRNGFIYVIMGISFSRKVMIKIKNITYISED